jgi:archaellum component FlaC
MRDEPKKESIGDSSWKDRQEAQKISDELLRTLGQFPAQIIGIIMSQITDLDNSVNELKAEISYLRKKVKELEK